MIKERNHNFGRKCERRYQKKKEEKVPAVATLRQGYREKKQEKKLQKLYKELVT